jgi:hypothetical protein
VQPQQHHPRRWMRRLITAVSACLFSAVVVAIQIPAARDAIGIAKTIYHFTDSTVPSLGVAAVWIGVVLLVGGAATAIWLHRILREGTGQTIAVGSAGLAVMLGLLIAVVSSLNQPTPIRGPSSYTASVTKHHKTTHRRHHNRKHSSPTSPKPAVAPAPAPAPANPAPSPAPSSGASSSSGGSGGNGNTVTVNKNTHQSVETGKAEGPNATSGSGTNNNTEGPVNISIG